MYQLWLMRPRQPRHGAHGRGESLLSRAVHQWRWLLSRTAGGCFKLETQSKMHQWEVVLETRGAGPAPPPIPTSQPHSPPLSCMCLTLQLPSVCMLPRHFLWLKPTSGPHRLHVLSETALIPLVAGERAHAVCVLPLCHWTRDILELGPCLILPAGPWALHLIHFREPPGAWPCSWHMGFHRENYA